MSLLPTEQRKALLDALAELLPRRSVRTDVPMRERTTLQIGGPADVLAEPQSPRQAMDAWREARRLGVPVTLIGNGSNLLVRDGGVRGLVLCIGEGMGEVFPPVKLADGAFEMTAQAGATLTKLANAAADAGLSGIEFLAGIPGTVGGGVTMNAGAYGGELKDVIRSVCLGGEDGELRTVPAAELGFAYRHSVVQEQPLLVVAATVRLTPCDSETVRTAMREFNARRRDRQPLNTPSCGSTFKRPTGFFAGALIDECELRGCRIGGASVSEKHAGFLVNDEGATAAEYLALIAHVQRTVYEKTGVRLEPEVRVIGEDAPARA